MNIDEKLSALEDEAYVTFHRANDEIDLEIKSTLTKKYEALLVEIASLETKGNEG
jgi:hypothetical protein